MSAVLLCVSSIFTFHIEGEARVLQHRQMAGTDHALEKGSLVFGLTAGLPVTLEGLAGANGKVFGMQSFGFSAPYKVLDEKLGFTAQNVYRQVKDMLKS